MILDQKQSGWVVATIVAFVALMLVYVIYVLASANGPRGGSVMGLIFGSVGMAIFIFECLLGLRKRYPVSPVGRVYTWLRVHIFLGLLCFSVVLMHSGFRWGHGLGAALMWLLLLVVVSGIFGVALQNYLPRRMKELVGKETIFEQIPLVIEGLRAEATERIEFATADLGAKDEIPEYQRAGGVKVYFDLEQKQSNAKKVRAVIEQRKQSPQIEIDEDARAALRVHYLREIRPYLANRPPDSSVERFRTRERIAAYFRHLCTVMPQPAHDILKDLEDLCEERRQLLIQRRLHLWLHGWLLVHVPLSFALLVLTAVHAVFSLRY